VHGSWSVKIKITTVPVSYVVLHKAIRGLEPKFVISCFVRVKRMNVHFVYKEFISLMIINVHYSTNKEMLLVTNNFFSIDLL
jgi:hypothetical protein